MIMTMRSVLLLVSLAVALRAAGAEDASTLPKITYDDHVKAILQQKCFACHNPDKKSGDLDLTTYTTLMAGGGSGSSIEPGDAAGSYLFQLVTHESEPAMPPESEKLAAEMIETLRQWIDQGVLENAGSKAKLREAAKFDLALSAASTERPEVVPMPGRMSLQPAVVLPTRTATDALATSPWAPLAALGSQHQVLLYRTDTLDLIGVLPFPEGNPKVLRFSRSGGLLLAGGGVGGASGRVVVWDIRSGERLIEVGDELDEVLAADISSDQTLIALAGPQRVVRIYRTDTGDLLQEIRKHTDWVTALEFSPDGVLLATGDRSGGLYIWESSTAREYLTLNGHTSGVTCLSWRSDSNVLASSSDDTTIRLWELENGTQVKSWAGHGGGASSVEFTRDGRLLSCGRDRVAKLWDQNGSPQVAYEAFADLALEATYCDETSRAICGDWNGEIRVWNATDASRIGDLVINPPDLQSRLATADEQLKTLREAEQPLVEAAKVAASNLAALQTQLAAASQKTAGLQTEVGRTTQQDGAAQAKIQQLTTDQTSLQTQIDGLAAALPLLREAAEKTTQASARIATDENLVAAGRMLSSAVDEKNTQLAALSQSLQQTTQALAGAAAEAEAAAHAKAEAVDQLAASQQLAETISAQIPPLEQAAEAAKQKSIQAADAIAVAQQAVTRWSEEILFSERLDALLERRSTLAASRDARESDLVEVEQQAASLRTEVEEIRQQYNSTQDEIKSLKQID